MSTSTAPGRPARRAARAPRRWVGLDAARGIAVVLATILTVAAWLGPARFGPTVGVGMSAFDLLPGALLVLVGTTVGWQRDAGVVWSPPRWRRRILVLVGAGLLVSFARAGADPTSLGPDELVRLAMASALAAWALRAPAWVLVPATGVLLMLPATLVGAGPAGRGLRSLPPDGPWALEHLVGLPATGVPWASLPAAVGLVLVGAGIGRWMFRRPPGPASAGALATVALWAAAVTVGVGQFRAAVPVLLDLPVATAAVGAALLGAVTTGWPHLVARPELPALAALTVGGVVATLVGALARRLATWRGRLTA